MLEINHVIVLKLEGEIVTLVQKEVSYQKNIETTACVLKQF